VKSWRAIFIFKNERREAWGGSMGEGRGGGAVFETQQQEILTFLKTVCDFEIRLFHLFCLFIIDSESNVSPVSLTRVRDGTNHRSRSTQCITLEYSTVYSTGSICMEYSNVSCCDYTVLVAL
jgi:hypothetical protein